MRLNIYWKEANFGRGKGGQYRQGERYHECIAWVSQLSAFRRWMNNLHIYSQVQHGFSRRGTTYWGGGYRTNEVIFPSFSVILLVRNWQTHISTFLFAGSDTTSSGISSAFYQLALHPDVQEKLRTEITSAREQHGDLSFETIMSLPYLDAVCRETLRVFPPAPRIFRKYVNRVNWIIYFGF